VNQTFNSTKGTGRRKSAVATVELVRGINLQSILSLVLIICNKSRLTLCYSSPIRFTKKINMTLVLMLWVVGL
jgi:ribosomal protein S9